MIYGVIPAGGKAKRLQPLGFSKELALVGQMAVIEYSLERMVLAGIRKIFITISADKSDLVRYLSTKTRFKNNLVFQVRPRKGLQDGILSPTKFMRPDDEIYWGLPDTIWYPKDGYKSLIKHPGKLVLGLFDTGQPDKFDSVQTDQDNRIQSIEVHVPNPKSKWTWGIGKLKVSEARQLDQFSKLQITKPPLFGISMDQYCKTNPGYALKFQNSHYLDIGRKDDYQKAADFLRENQE